MNNSQRGLTIALISLIGISVLVSLASIFSTPGGQREGKLSKAVNSDHLAANKPGIAIVPIYGGIEVSQERGMLGLTSDGSDGICDMLDTLQHNKNIKAIVLRINSPGGSIGAVQEIYQKIEELKANGVKVVASMGDIAASGGYYLACTADKIYANPGTLTGSIGVIMSSVEFGDALSKFGVHVNVIKSGPHKDIFSPYRKMTDKENKILQSCINDSYSQFLGVVAGARKIPMSSLREIADGRIFTGRQAKSVGLVDELGSLDSAIAAAGKLAGLGDNPHIYSEQDYYLNGILKQFNIYFNQKNWAKVILNSGIPKIEYRFTP